MLGLLQTYDLANFLWYYSTHNSNYSFKLSKFTFVKKGCCNASSAEIRFLGLYWKILSSKSTISFEALHFNHSPHLYSLNSEASRRGDSFPVKILFVLLLSLKIVLNPLQVRRYSKSLLAATADPRNTTIRAPHREIIRLNTSSSFFPTRKIQCFSWFINTHPALHISIFES